MYPLPKTLDGCKYYSCLKFTLTNIEHNVVLLVLSISNKAEHQYRRYTRRMLFLYYYYYIVYIYIYIYDLNDYSLQFI